MIFQLTKEREWNKWFAWHPVRLYGNKLAWLTVVERWHSRTAYCPYQYREVEDKS